MATKSLAAHRIYRHPSGNGGRPKGPGYRASGVDREALDAFKASLAPIARGTFTPRVIDNFGSFAGLVSLKGTRLKEPVLVATCDGVGTKLLVARQAQQYHSLGIDLVAMSANDILTTGARPLFFLDYIAFADLEPRAFREVVEGIAEGCAETGMALIGGETAQLPGIYGPERFDLAGFAVGIGERRALLGPERVASGDFLIGLRSSGIHANGFSLARKVLLERGRLGLGARPKGLGGRLSDALLAPTRLYERPVRALLDARGLRGALHAAAHVTGGGIEGNLSRALPAGADAVIDAASWPIPPIFRLVQRTGPVPIEEMFRVFNMGIGMVLAVDRKARDKALDLLRQAGEDPVVMGRIVPGEGSVKLMNVARLGL